MVQCTLRVLIFCCCLCSVLVLGYDLRNPALNPVRIQKAPEHADLVLVKDGKLCFSIVHDKDCEKHVRYEEHRSIPAAVKLLAVEIEQCTGVKPVVLDVSETEKMRKYPVRLLVGGSALTKELGVDVSALPREGFMVRTFPGTVVIAGNDSSLKKGFNRHDYAHRATLWGAYDFLERFFGCRYYFPGKYGTLHPKTKSLILRPLSYIDAPRFQNRPEEWVVWEYYGYGNKTIYPRLLELFGPLDRADINASMESWRLGHTIPFWAGHNPRPEGLLAAYPNQKDLIFYRAHEGRQYYNPKTHTGNYFDVTNLKLADLLIDSLKRCYASYGKGVDRCGWAFVKDIKKDTFISFGQCDSDVPLPDMINHPTVVRERLLTQRHIDEQYNYSDIYARFFQYLGNRIKEEFPGKKLYLIPYASYARPPLDPRWKLPDNVELRVCVGRFPGWVRNPQIAAEEKKKLCGWYENLGHRPIASLWLYNTPGNPFARAIAPQLIGEVCKLYGETLGNVDIFFDQWGGQYHIFYYANYAGVRAMWNPDFNCRAAVDEHWVPFYGPKAGPYLKEFHGILYDMHMNTYTPRTDRLWNPLYPLKSITRLEQLLQLAEKALAPDSVEMKRFRIFAKPFRGAINAQKIRHDYKRPSYGIHRLLDTEKVVVDGRKEGFWNKLSSMPLQDPHGSGVAVSEPAVIRLAWGDKGIYGLIESPHPPVADSGKSVWENSSYEIFLSPGIKKKDYFQFVVDDMNQRFTGTRHLFPVDQPYNGFWKCPGFKSAVIRETNSWTMEFFVPFEPMKAGVPKAHDVWYGNIVMNRKSSPETFASTAMTVGNNHNLKMYGFFKFLGVGK